MSKNGRIAFATVNFFKQAQYLKKPDVQSGRHPRRNPAVHFPAGQLWRRTPSVNLTSPTGSPDEGIGLIATAVVLFLAFGSLFAMLLPLGRGALRHRHRDRPRRPS
jgi:RND superfamily putative drug exporter